MRIRTFTAALALAMVAGAASAAPFTALIDFTDRSQWSGSDAGATTSQSYGPLTVTLSTRPENRANFNQDFDARNPIPAECGVILACESDGLGVIGDEITSVNLLQTPPNESATLEFSKPVRIKTLYFLDIFTNEPGAGGITTFEQANVYVDGAGVGAATTFQAALPFQQSGGFLKVEGLNIQALLSATFFASAFPNNDAAGAPDFAIAGVEVEVVPLPATALLLVGAIAGFGLLGRRRQTA